MMRRSCGALLAIHLATAKCSDDDFARPTGGSNPGHILTSAGHVYSRPATSILVEAEISPVTSIEPLGAVRRILGNCLVKNEASRFRINSLELTGIQVLT